MSGASGDEIAPINRDPLGHSSIMETALGDGTVSTPRAHVEQSPKKGEKTLEKWTKKKGLLDTRVLAPVVGALAMLGLGAQSASAQSLVDGVTAASSNSGFVQSFLLIFASEIGDKTFFIAGLLAAKYSRLISLAGSLGALAAMTVISVVIGRVFHALPPGLSGGLPLDDYAAVLAFAYFGAKTLYDAYKLPAGDSSGIEEEKKEAEEAVEEATGTDKKQTLAAILSTFGLVFAAG
jgi:putative Ca2+/H+ antiporter (TMEM165/GDT1 family)